MDVRTQENEKACTYVKHKLPVKMNAINFYKTHLKRDNIGNLQF